MEEDKQNNELIKSQYNDNLDINSPHATLDTANMEKSVTNETTDLQTFGEKDKDDVSRTEDQVIKYKYPRAVPFIISNEFCERFNYYGLRTILVIYLTQNLHFSDDDSTIIYHVYTMLVYFLCIFGAILSDSFLGKFRTILYLSMVYACGSILVAIGAIPTLNLNAVVFTMVGLGLIALGSGGIKPCVSAFGGDQFKIPEQLKQMTTFFSVFYFAINSGSLVSTTLTPILRQDVHCFGQNECFSLAFGVPAVLMFCAIIIFALGKPLYKTKPPAGNMVVLVSKTIGNAVVTKVKQRKEHPKEHWLDYAEPKYGKQLVDDVKVLMRILFLYVPLPFFWALFDQQGSRWTLQATRMNGDFGSFDIKPDQLQLVNPLLILVFIPLYEVAFYPLLNLVGIRRPLQKLTLGGILAGISFVVSGIVELQLEQTYPVIPGAHNAQLRVFNGENCEFVFNSPSIPSFTVPPYSYFENKNINFDGNQLAYQYSVSSTTAGCPGSFDGNLILQERNAYSFFLGSQSNANLIWYTESVQKPSRDSMVRTIANLPESTRITWKKGGSVAYENTAIKARDSLVQVGSGTYDVLVNNVQAGQVDVQAGAVYTVMVTQNAGNSYTVRTFTITEPNTLNILWLIPQYVIITLGEVMFSVTGLEFSYSQAPNSMKSVIQACWQLTVAFGNVIVVIVAEAKIFESQAYEFFLFAVLMIVDMGIFMIFAWKYKPNYPNQSITDENESSSDELALNEKNKQ